MHTYQPPFTPTPGIISLVADVAEAVGRLSAATVSEATLRLRRINRIRTIQGSLAIEGNTLSEEQITAILAGKHVLAPPASRVPVLMKQLMTWLGATDLHPLIAGSVFHYEFEFIHPFADGNGRMGRLWQTLILTRWNPAFAHIPVESLVHAHQAGYYDALNASTRQSDAAPFVAFMLARVLEAVAVAAPQVTPQVMELVRALRSEMSRDELQSALGLNDRKSFAARYLTPALAAGLIEYTRPDAPRSRLQKYRRTALGKTLHKRS